MLPMVISWFSTTSMLLYSTLHLAGVVQSSSDAGAATRPAISLDDIRNFRQLDSPCAGHPEHGEVSGIEMTTGPLGQGVATSVGMAIAGNWFAARYDRADQTLFGFDTYVICSDGDLMEGIGCEAASMAGHLQLSNLCWIYDDNNITIEGECDLAYSEDVATKYQSLGWSTVTVADANDLAEIRAAFEKWSDKITANSANVSALRGTAVYGTGTVLHLDRSEKVIRRYVLEQIFPTSIAGIDLTSDGNDTVEEYTVGFAVNGIFSKSTGSLDASKGGLDIDVDLSINATVGPLSLTVG